MAARPNLPDHAYLRVWLSALLLALSLTTHAKASEFLTGRLLVASSEMEDPRFAQSVIYMVKHDSEGALGLIINQPIAKGSIKDLLKSFGVEDEHASGDIVLHFGGPVSRFAGFILHSDDVTLAGSTQVTDGIAMTSDAKLIQTIAQNQGPQHYLVMLGYAGWARGQLESELLTGAWHAIAADKTLIFSGDAANKWRRAMDRRQVPL
jgi:putative transcriptional regulator